MEIKSGKNYIKYFVAGLITFVYFLFNLFFLQRSLDHDSVVYTNNVRWMMIVNKNFFNPHHLHFEISGIYFHKYMNKDKTVHKFKYLMFNLRMRSLLIACLGIFALIILLTKLTNSLGYGVLGALLACFTHGYLYNAAKIDTAIFPLAWIGVVFWMFYELTTKKNVIIFYINSLILGVCFFIGIMFHQYFVLVSVSITVMFFIPDKIFFLKIKSPDFVTIKQNKSESIFKKSFKQRAKSFTIIVLVTSILTTGAYFWSGAVYYGLPFKKDHKAKVDSLWKKLTFQKWLFAYRTKRRSSETWGDGFSKFHPKLVLRGVTDAFLSQKHTLKYNKIKRFNYDLKNIGNRAQIAHNALAVFLALFFVIFILFFIPALKKYKYIFGAFVLNFILFSLLGVYWEPYYFEFWLIPAVLVIVIFTLLLNTAADKLKIITGKLSHIAFYFLLFAFLYIFFLHNLKYYVVPHSFKLPVEGLTKEDREKNAHYFSQGIYKYPYDPYKNFKKRGYK